MTNYTKDNQPAARQIRKKKENEALNLEKFMHRAGPVMEGVIDENDQLHFLNNRDQA